MSLTIKAATAMHFAGVAYAAGDTIDTTGMNDRSIAVLLKHQPVYVSAASSAGVPFVKAFDVTFDSPSLHTGYDTGYSPAVDDILLDAWIDVITPFNGSTPKLDIGFFLTGETYGIFGGEGAPANISVPPGTFPTGWIRAGDSTMNLISNDAQFSVSAVPTRVTESHPLKIMVSSTGRPDTGVNDSTAGHVRVYTKWVTPA